MTDSHIVRKAEKQWKARELNLSEPWRGAFIQLPGLPLRSSLRPGLRDTLWQVANSVRSAAPLKLSTWLLMDSLHKDGAVHALSKYSQEWLPNFGLGIWPDGEAPRMYQDNDFLNLEFGAEFPKMMHSMVHISSDENGAKHAWETMFGTGSTVLTLSEEPADTILQEMREPALEKIRDETFRSFPWYFTVLGRKFVTDAETSLLERWLGQIQFYMRESEEDEGVLILSRYGPIEDLIEALQAAGFSLT